MPQDVEGHTRVPTSPLGATPRASPIPCTLQAPAIRPETNTILGSPNASSASATPRPGKRRQPSAHLRPQQGCVLAARAHRATSTTGCRPRPGALTRPWRWAMKPARPTPMSTIEARATPMLAQRLHRGHPRRRRLRPLAKAIGCGLEQCSPVPPAMPPYPTAQARDYWPALQGCEDCGLETTRLQPGGLAA